MNAFLLPSIAMQSPCSFCLCDAYFDLPQCSSECVQLAHLDVVACLALQWALLLGGAGSRDRLAGRGVPLHAVCILERLRTHSHTFAHLRTKGFALMPQPKVLLPRPWARVQRWDKAEEFFRWTYSTAD